MRKVLLLLLVGISVFLGYSFAKDKVTEFKTGPKVEVLRFAMVADSHDENGLLKKALSEAKAQGASFVIGLGDYTEVGTLAQLRDAKKAFDGAQIEYFATAGDHDLWDSRNRGSSPLSNFKLVFGDASHEFVRQGVKFVILDNSDIYRGLNESQWSIVDSQLSDVSNLTFVFAHKTPFHPQSAHIMGEDNAGVADQAKQLVTAFEQNKIDGFFCGDLHFFAQFNSPNNIVKMTTVGAVASQRNFQGSRFAIVKVYNDFSWEVSDIEIK